MAWGTLDGDTIMNGILTIPYRGTWCADLTCALPTNIPVLSKVVLGNLTLVGTAVRFANYGGSRSVRIVGGSGGWRKFVTSRSYSQASGIQLSTVLNDLANECGETVKIATDQTIGRAYVRSALQASVLLAELAGPEWWVDTAGTTQIAGTRDASQILSPFNVTTYNGGEGRFRIATEDLASWMPGRTFVSATVPVGKQIASVTYHMTNEGSTRVEVFAQ